MRPLPRRHAQMFSLLDKITQGKATMADLAQLEDLCRPRPGTSLCGLGQGAPNPVLSTLRYFRDEYRAHRRLCLSGRYLR